MQDWFRASWSPREGAGLLQSSTESSLQPQAWILAPLSHQGGTSTAANHKAALSGESQAETSPSHCYRILVPDNTREGPGTANYAASKPHSPRVRLSPGLEYLVLLDFCPLPCVPATAPVSTGFLRDGVPADFACWLLGHFPFAQELLA